MIVWADFRRWILGSAAQPVVDLDREESRGRVRSPAIEAQASLEPGQPSTATAASTGSGRPRASVRGAGGGVVLEPTPEPQPISLPSTTTWPIQLRFDRSESRTTTRSSDLETTSSMVAVQDLPVLAAVTVIWIPLSSLGSRATSGPLRAAPQSLPTRLGFQPPIGSCGLGSWSPTAPISCVALVLLSCSAVRACRG